MKKKFISSNHIIKNVIGGDIINFFDIICFVVTIELLYYTYKAVQWNFNHGYALRQGQNTSIIIRMTIFISIMIFVSSKTKILSVSIIFIYLLCLFKYIENKNLKMYKNNSDLLNFYMFEIKKIKKCIYISALICYIVIIINFCF